MLPRPVLLLFDVDATLLLTDGLGVACMCAAFEELHGAVVDPTVASFPGGLDPLIWRDLARANGLPDAPPDHARFRARYGALLRERLAAEPGRTRALAGVPELLAALAGRSDLALGLLTGNYPETAALKVAAAGLDPALFPIGAFGTDGDHRRALPPVAMRRHRERTGRAPRPAEVVVIGDTPRDVDCARANGCRSLAVATGRFGVAELCAAGADAALESLAGVERVLAAIDAVTRAKDEPPRA